MQTLNTKRHLLQEYTNDTSVIAELAAYTKNKFCPDNSLSSYRDFVDEPQIETWEQYIEESKDKGIFEVLKKYLVQFQFPIKENISQTKAYKSVTLKGANPKYIESATGLQLEAPQQLKLYLHQSLSGKIPVLIIENRNDFLSIVRALSCRNEPDSLPDSMGAGMIKGLNNWDRLRKAKRNFGSNISTSDLLKKKELYQDNIIVLSKIPYSNVSAKMIGLTHEDWLNESLKIRLAHECAHYFTYRHFGEVANNMHDELIADYMGIGAVLPHFKSDWFLKFIGLEDYPKVRISGRVKNYLGKPALSNSASKILQNILVKASDNLEIFDQQIAAKKEDRNRVLRLLSLCHLDLIEIASREGIDLMIEVYNNLQKVA